MSVPTTREKFSESNCVRYPEPLPISNAYSPFSFSMFFAMKKVSSDGGYSSFSRICFARFNYFIS